jgi:hypothetical protein
MGKGTFTIIVNQTENKAKAASSDSQFLIPGFPASKLRAEKIVLSSYGQPLNDGKGKVTHGPEPCPFLFALVPFYLLPSKYLMVLSFGHKGRLLPLCVCCRLPPLHFLYCYEVFKSQKTRGRLGMCEPRYVCPVVFIF